MQQALDASRVVEGGVTPGREERIVPVSHNRRLLLNGGETVFPALLHEGIVVTFSQNQVRMKSCDGVVVKCAEFGAGDSGDLCWL